jgi:hypothetical protein
MEKVTISLVVPERIAALVQFFVQHNLCGEGNPNFKDYLEMSGVKKPGKYMSEMEIGIIHPDDDDIIRVKSFGKNDYPLAHEVLREFILPTYFDPELDENLWSYDVVFEKLFIDDEKAKSQLLEIKAILDRDNCSYFRFEKH